MDDILVLILAAGSSSRLGKPKQLETLSGKSLIRHAVETCLDAGFTRVFVVVGHAHGQVQREIESYPVDVLFNQEWQKGMGFSLSYGLKEAEKRSKGHLRGLLVCLSDQPFVTAGHLRNLHSNFGKGKKKVVASGFNDTYGPPLLCDKTFFSQILELNGDEGAKKIFNNSITDLTIVDFPPADLDIDEPDDLRMLNG